MAQFSNNPLMNFARRPELSIKLPSNGGWYDDGMIDYTPNGEVEVYPMLPADELLMMNPDALLSGQANISLIKSCVPAIKEPEKVLYPDANVLFLAIQRATYGDKLSITTPCPKCREKMEGLSEEEIAEKEKAGELQVHNFELSYSIDEILQRITYLEPECVITTNTGLKIYLSPDTIKNKYMYSNVSLNYRKLMKMYRENTNTESIDEERSAVVVDAYMKLNELNNKLIASSITKVVLPDDSVVSDPKNIYEFISNSGIELVTELNNKRKELNDVGLPTTLNMECPSCGHTWEDVFYGYNQSDFFGIGS